METSKKEQFKLEAFKEGISMAELCRKKIQEAPQLIRIELMLERLIRRRY